MTIASILSELKRSLVESAGTIVFGMEDGTAYRKRLNLASGCFAMIDDGLGFSLVPWRPTLERQLERPAGIVSGSGIERTLGRQRGLSIG